MGSEVEVGMKIGEAVPGGSVTYVSSDPQSLMACCVRNELGAQGKGVTVDGPDRGGRCNQFNMSSSSMSVSGSGPQVSSLAPAPAFSPSA